MLSYSFIIFGGLWVLLILISLLNDWIIQKRINKKTNDYSSLTVNSTRNSETEPELNF